MARKEIYKDVAVVDSNRCSGCHAAAAADDDDDHYYNAADAVIGDIV